LRSEYEARSPSRPPPHSRRRLDAGLVSAKSVTLLWVACEICSRTGTAPGSNRGSLRRRLSSGRGRHRRRRGSAARAPRAARATVARAWGIESRAALCRGQYHPRWDSLNALLRVFGGTAVLRRGRSAGHGRCAWSRRVGARGMLPSPASAWCSKC
jgi:hypothetical protein